MKWTRTVRSILAGALCLGLTLTVSAAAPAAETPERELLGIYSTGGLHGQVYAKDPLTGGEAPASFLKAASAVAQQRRQVAASLLLDSGCALNGGAVSGWDLNGQADPAALALRLIGYDALVPSLGEFLAPPAYRQQVFDQLSAQEGEGAPVALLSANCLDQEGDPLLKPYQVFSVELEGQTWKIGVAGLGLLDAERVLPEDRREGLRFRHSSNEAGTYAWEWNQYLRLALTDAEECDFIVVVCDAPDIAAFVAQTRDIDLILTHAEEAASHTYPDAGQVQVPCISSDGATLTRTLVGVTEEGGLAVESYGHVDLSSYSDDPALAAALKDFASPAAALALQRAGTLSLDWIEDVQGPYAQSGPFDLTARAMCWASGADAALLSPADLGVSSLNGFFGQDTRSAVLTLADCYEIYPYPYSALCLVELTGKQIRDWLDVCAGRYDVDENGYLTGGETADALYGLSYELYVGSLPGRRVEHLTWKGDELGDFQRLRVAVDARRLADPEFPEVEVLWTALSDPRFTARGGSIPAVLAGYADQSALLSPLREDTWSIYTGSSYGPMNRLEFVTMLYELAGKPEPAVDTAFVDLSGDPAAVWAAESGIVSVDGQGRVLTTQLVTREQAAVILSRFAQTRGLTTHSDGKASQLVDYVTVAPWAQPAVDFCYGSGIMPAVGAGALLFRPQDTFTRQEACEFLAALNGLFAED